MASVNAVLMMPALETQSASVEHVLEEVQLASPHALEILTLVVMACVNAVQMTLAMF